MKNSFLHQAAAWYIYIPTVEVTCRPILRAWLWLMWRILFQGDFFKGKLGFWSFSFWKFKLIYNLLIYILGFTMFRGCFRNDQIGGFRLGVSGNGVDLHCEAMETSKKDHFWKGLERNDFQVQSPRQSPKPNGFEGYKLSQLQCISCTFISMLWCVWNGCIVFTPESLDPNGWISVVKDTRQIHVLAYNYIYIFTYICIYSMSKSRPQQQKYLSESSGQILL